MGLNNGYQTLREFTERVLPPGTYSKSQMAHLISEGRIPQFEKFGREYLIQIERVADAKAAVLAYKANKRAVRAERAKTLSRSRDHSLSMGGISQAELTRRELLAIAVEIRDLLKTQTTALAKLTDALG